MERDSDRARERHKEAEEKWREKETDEYILPELDREDSRQANQAIPTSSRLE